MKKILIAIAILFGCTIQMQAQEVYKEIMRMSKDVANDKARNLHTRKIATFKVDELNYMAMKARELMPDSSMRMLDVQALAMYEYVDIFIKRLTAAQKKKDKEDVMNVFKQASIENPRYFDMEKDLVLSYYNNNNYLTQFSLDTDWVKALATIKKRYNLK